MDYLLVLTTSYRVVGINWNVEKHNIEKTLELENKIRGWGRVS